MFKLQVAMPLRPMKVMARRIFNNYVLCRGVVTDHTPQLWWVDPRYLLPTEGEQYSPYEEGYKFSPILGSWVDPTDGKRIDAMSSDGEWYRPSYPNPEWIDDMGNVVPMRGPEYAADYTTGQYMPPICTDSAFQILNGHHRAFSARLARCPAVLVLVGTRLIGWCGGCYEAYSSWSYGQDRDWAGWEGDHYWPRYSTQTARKYGECEQLNFNLIQKWTKQIPRPEILKRWEREQHRCEDPAYRKQREAAACAAMV